MMSIFWFAYSVSIALAQLLLNFNWIDIVWHTQPHTFMDPSAAGEQEVQFQRAYISCLPCFMIIFNCFDIFMSILCWRFIFPRFRILFHLAATPFLYTVGVGSRPHSHLVVCIYVLNFQFNALICFGVLGVAVFFLAEPFQLPKYL